MSRLSSFYDAQGRDATLYKAVEQCINYHLQYNYPITWKEFLLKKRYSLSILYELITVDHWTNFLTNRLLCIRDPENYIKDCSEYHIPGYIHVRKCVKSILAKKVMQHLLTSKIIEEN